MKTSKKSRAKLLNDEKRLGVALSHEEELKKFKKPRAVSKRK